jgi:gliding motility-associated-like protein
MAIYNRYGQMIYSTEDKLDRGWDGTFKGQKSAVDTYMYLINVVSNEGKKKVFKGDVTLVR